MGKKILFLILSMIILPNVGISQSCFDALNPLHCMIDAALNTTLYIASAIVIILWLVVGYLFLSSQGNPDKINTAKKALLWAIVGTVIIIASQYAMDIIGSAFGI